VTASKPNQSAPIVACPEAFGELVELIGAEAAVLGLYRLREQIAAMEHVSDEDRLELVPRAHALVSQAALLGFPELSATCKALEEVCRSAMPVGAASRAAKDAALRARAAADVMIMLTRGNGPDNGPGRST
jgi:hypothetical protein